jgi:hypothetical protein
MSTIIDNLQWGEPFTRDTKKGPKVLKVAPPNEAFWDLYRVFKDKLQAAGITLFRNGGDWSVNWWQRNGVFVRPEIGNVEIGVKDKTLELLPLVNETNLKPWQPKQVQIICASMKRYGVSLNADGTGVGKTFETLAAIRETGRRAVVICPKTIVPDWQRAAHKMGVKLAGVHGWEWVKTGKTFFGHWDIVKCPTKKNPNKTKRGDFIWVLPDDVDLVFDEVHRASGMDTQNAHLLIRAKKQKYRIYALSATIADDPTKMNAIGQMLDLHEGGKGFYNWMCQHGVRREEIRVGGRVITLWKFRGNADHLKTIHHDIFPMKGCRIRANEIADFPETQIVAKAYEMEEAGAIRREYDRMKAEIERIMASKDTENKQACILVEILRARQRVEYLKIPLMVSLTRDYIEEGNSVILAVNFLETLGELVKQLEITSIICGISSGKKIIPGYTENRRQNAIDDFQSDSSRIVGGILAAMREGISLHDMNGDHPRVNLISPPQSSFQLKQVLGRPQRAGGKSPSIQRILFAADTIEEQVCESLATKLDKLDLIMDGDLQDGIFPPGYSDMRPDEDVKLL